MKRQIDEQIECGILRQNLNDGKIREEAEEEAKEIRRINRNIAQAELRAAIELAAKLERNAMRHLMIIGSISADAKIPGCIDILERQGTYVPPLIAHRRLNPSGKPPNPYKG